MSNLNKQIKVKDICDFLLEKYPLDLCSSFDMGKTGLQFGSYNKNVKKVMITLDAASYVIDEALEKNCDMIVSHHPFMFSPMLNLNYESNQGKKMLKVFKNELNIFAMHTNFDAAVDGMNDYLATLIGLKDVKMVPDGPTADSFMRIGKVDDIKLLDYANLIKKALGETNVRVVGDLNKIIKKAAIIGGSGGLYVMDAYRNGCDVIITGEIKQNNAIDALENGIAVIEVSHGVEANFKKYIQKMLQEEFKNVEFIISEKDVNPFKVI